MDTKPLEPNTFSGCSSRADEGLESVNSRHNAASCRYIRVRPRHTTALRSRFAHRLLEFIVGGLLVVQIGCASSSSGKNLVPVPVDESLVVQMSVEEAIEIIGGQLGQTWARQPTIQRSHLCGQPHLQEPRSVGEQVFYRDMALVWADSRKTHWELRITTDSLDCRAILVVYAEESRRNLAAAFLALREADRQGAVEYGSQELIHTPITSNSTSLEIERAFLSRRTPSSETNRLMEIYVRKLVEKVPAGESARFVAPPTPEVGFTLSSLTRWNSQVRDHKLHSESISSRELIDTGFGKFTWSTWEKTSGSLGMYEISGEETRSHFLFTPFPQRSTSETSLRSADGGFDEMSVSTAEAVGEASAVYPLFVGKVLTGQYRTKKDAKHTPWGDGAPGSSASDQLSVKRCVVTGRELLEIDHRAEPVIVIRCLDRVVADGGLTEYRSVETTYVSELLGTPFRVGTETIRTDIDMWKTSETIVTGYSF